MKRCVGLLLAVALACGACASTQRSPAGARASSSSPLASSPPPSRASGGAAAGGTEGSPAPTPVATRQGTASPAPASWSAVRIDIVIAGCLERARPATATIRTEPGAMIVASATYSDGQSYYNYWVGTAGPSGEYSVAWTPPPEAPLGNGKFLVGVQSDAGGNTATKPFRLARAGACG